MRKIFVTSFLLASSFSVGAQAASFDCAKAGTNIEKLICSNESISAQDENLAKTYKSALDASADKNELKQQQLAWLKTRNTCTDDTCLTQRYRDRIIELTAISLKKATATTTENKTETKAEVKVETTKKPLTFKLIEGAERPICQQYIHMLEATKYTETPACERKVLPQFPQFNAIKWVEITDKQEMIRVIEERFQINSKMDSLQATPPSLSAGERFALLESIKKDRFNMYFFKKDINADGIDEIFYNLQEKGEELKQFDLCESHNIFYVNDSKIKVENITSKTKNPYDGFNWEFSTGLFIFNDSIYASVWKGTLKSEGSNLDIYEVGNNKLCGILVK